jgi:hypothetical protein
MNSRSGYARYNQDKWTNKQWTYLSTEYRIKDSTQRNCGRIKICYINYRTSTGIFYKNDLKSDINRYNISCLATNHVVNAESVEVNPKHCGKMLNGWKWVLNVVLIVVDSIMSPGQVCDLQYIRNYSKYNLNKFQEMLSYELWDVFTNDNINNIFNTFLNTYLRIFYPCFTRRKITPRLMYNSWITQGIWISCIRKRELYLRYRQDSDPHLNLYYKKYCRVLAKVIKEAKKACYDYYFKIP